MEYILSIDAGTTSNRIVCFDLAGNVVSTVAQEFPQLYPRPGWVEHDATVIWEDTRRLLEQSYRRLREEGGAVVAIGITNQRETVVLWDAKSGEPLCNAVVWQDRRGAEICARLRDAGLEEYIHTTTGLVIDPYFSASKIAWLLETYPELRSKAEQDGVCFGTIDSWLLYNLTGGQVHATDYSNASRTMLYDIQRLRWDERLLSELRIPSTILPEVLPSSHLYGHTAPQLLDGAKVPIGGMAGDQQSALFGQACFTPGMGKNTYGTGSFALMNIGGEFRKSTHRLLTTIAWDLGAAGGGAGVVYALEGSVFITGAAIQWLRDGIGVIAQAAETQALAESIDSNGDVYFVPAFVGLGTPHWDTDARGMIIGITGGTGRAELARATLESIAYQSREVLEAMSADAGTPLTELRVDGGAVVNDFLMQFQADILGGEVVRPEVIESTARGSAFLAGLARGVWSGVGEIAQIWREERRFVPRMDDETRGALFSRWKEAVRRSKGWAQ